MKKLGLVLGALLLTFVISHKAHAIPFAGEIEFGGAGFFADPTFDVLNDVALVTASDGDFIGVLDFGDEVVFRDFDITVGSSTVPLWSGNNVVFDLNEVLTSSHSGTEVDATGEGIITAPGFDPTPFAWSFSADATGARFGFSSTNSPVDVPEPATLGLMGIGLAALGYAARRRRKMA